MVTLIDGGLKNDLDGQGMRLKAINALLNEMFVSIICVRLYFQKSQNVKNWKRNVKLFSA